MERRGPLRCLIARIAGRKARARRGRSMPPVGDIFTRELFEGLFLNIVLPGAIFLAVILWQRRRRGRG